MVFTNVFFQCTEKYESAVPLWKSTWMCWKSRRPCFPPALKHNMYVWIRAVKRVSKLPHKCNPKYICRAWLLDQNQPGRPGQVLTDFEMMSATWWFQFLLVKRSCKHNGVYVISCFISVHKTLPFHGHLQGTCNQGEQTSCNHCIIWVVV